MKYASFCYPMKAACLQFLYDIYLDTEKSISEDFHSSLWEAVEIIYEDLKKYIEIKINSGKRSHKHMRDESEAFGEVDVSRNFIMRDCFGAEPITKLLEQYVFLQVIPSLNKFFELRLRLNETNTNLVRNIIRLTAESAKHTAGNV